MLCHGAACKGPLPELLEVCSRGDAAQDALLQLRHQRQPRLALLPDEHHPQHLQARYVPLSNCQPSFRWEAALRKALQDVPTPLWAGQDCDSHINPCKLMQQSSDAITEVIAEQEQFSFLVLASS